MSRPPRPRTSVRTARLGFSDIVKIRNQVLAMIAGGRDVIRLEGGEPYPPTPEFVKDAIKRALDENQTRYAPSSGIPALIEAIRRKLAERNGIEADASQIIVVNGGAHGLFCAFQATLDEGDEAIFFSPYWTPIRDLVSYAGGTPVLVPWAELATRTAADAIEERITPRTRILYLNSPSNPTGNVISRGDLEQLAALAIRHDLVVVADEAYEDLCYEEPHASIAALPGMMERTLTVYTLSKSFSMTGGRIGYVVAGEAFMDVLRKLVLNSTNGVSTPTQFGALAAVSDRSDYLQTTRDEYRRRRDILVAGALGAGFRCSPPGGAFYLFADVRERLGGDSWAAMKSLLDRTGIATVPGAVFGREGEGHLRMSFSNPIAVLERAVGALRGL
ncbi:MAG TPA: aminotransferase class I/II-fold pyridoxal phosphate-dependent enzyme [Thermoanaerobaculia bacterium]|nr:aminotransferase class I/II-fold pyridoxal phosphate-dependent enzyme [Thermoanaerobaculia bacterium]